MDFPRVLPDTFRISLELSEEEKVALELNEKKRKKREKKIVKLSEQAAEMVKMTQKNSVLESYRWRGLKIDLEKLQFILARLNKELARQRKKKLS